MNPSACAVLVPVSASIEPETEAALRILSDRGYSVQMLRGSSQVDLARSTLATLAMRDGFKETFWIDSDQAFNPDDVEKIRARGLPFTVGLYVTKGPKRFACKFREGSGRVTFGVGGGLLEIEYAGMGFTHIRAEVYEAIAKGLPVCKGGYEGQTVIPYFRPQIVPEGDGECYLSEDFSFCNRAKQAGFKVMADTTIKVGHIGKKTYTWDDLLPDANLDSIHVELDAIASPAVPDAPAGPTPTEEWDREVNEHMRTIEVLRQLKAGTFTLDRLTVTDRGWAIDQLSEQAKG